ncbi:Kdo hydroxylase family protein [Methylococcus geothermalis]|uniref:3-deoxy-D-manno-oct-2-ulosonic acid (Kdo) hydroxylase n=1 Tax=Methylococcus geothermalis TaxID=2681310 RepID=A0A858QAL5_9GAMM|nr:Kdo hydroxylase family protein [Methylococcus geothermalis]QJD30982.1 3-deoxy-D-manno-oct-2-ulosonic acid (Kdo) hydroxylase [Methylococcus geothermalis]
MSRTFEFDTADWDVSFSAEKRGDALNEIEQGKVLYFPNLGFGIEENEKAFLSPQAVAKSKNVSFDAASGDLHGTGPAVADVEALRGMMARFAARAAGLVARLLPEYSAALVQGRTSFRPVEAAGRASSWRKDDTRLHVDAFPSSPVQGRRLLRVFSNVNPEGRPRCWRLGEAFEPMARRFLPSIPAPLPGSGPLLQWLGLTKSRRSAYDHYMLQLHDRMKADMAYQAEVDQAPFDFPPSTTWMVFTDQASHAVMSGQYLLEQTFYVPVEAMRDPAKSPLKILERLTGRALV